MIPIFLAVDTADINEAHKLLSNLAESVDVKLGLQFFIAHGPKVCSEIRNYGWDGRKLFLDLKLHDIPNTVAGAIRSALPVEADFITVHASGGVDMMRAAVAAANEAAVWVFKRPKILGVTVLTSDNGTTPRERAIELAFDALSSGLDGLICSPHEVSHFRSVFADLWPDLFLMVPGIREKGADTHDQQRVATAREAMDAGASALVIGRAITNATDPRAALEAIMETLK